MALESLIELISRNKSQMDEIVNGHKVKPSALMNFLGMEDEL